ncbi:MAG TPA: serine/threonine protein kinase [Burkholderiaceae bacterium]|nr:serine/threonine protein kinase [Burkholderiaceae bacterium]
MNKPIAKLSALLAGLLMTAGMASAQLATPVPTAAGEASTMGAQGQPNAAEKTDKSTSRADVRAEAAAQAKTAANSALPKGEASTTGPKGQPNMAPAGTAPESKITTRAERKADRAMHKATKNADPVDYTSMAKRPDPTFKGSSGTPN